MSVLRDSAQAAERLAGRLSEHRPALRAQLMTRRAQLLEARIRLLAAWAGAEVEVHIGTEVEVGRRIHVSIEPGTSSTLVVADHASIDDDVRIHLKGGEVHLGPGAHLRPGVVLNVSGRLHVGEQALLSWGSIVHCAHDVDIGRRAFIGEFTTIVDSSHFFTSPDEWAYGNVSVGPVRIGENTWVAAKATIARSVTIGAHCIISASAVVLEDIPPGHLAAGVPAKARPLDLPWDRADGAPADGPVQPPSSSS
jgi:acetyltransferase-like isoleucine patch superfamily enzyme